MKTLPFFKGLSRLLFLNLLVKPVWIFFIDREVQNQVGNEAYGRYFALLNLTLILLFLADAGLSNMLNQRIANRESLDIRQLFRLKGLLLLLYAASCLILGGLAGIRQWNILAYLILVQALGSLFLFLRSLVTAHQFFAADAWFSVIDKLLMIVLCGLILYGMTGRQISLQLFLQVQAFCTALAVALVCFFMWKKELLRHAVAERTGSLFRRMLPFIVLIFLMALHYRLDGFLLERLHPSGALEAGIYAAAYRITDTANMVGYLAASFLVPYIARHYKEKEILEEAVLTTRHGLMFFAIGLVGFCWVFAPWVQELLYHKADPYASRVIAYSVAVLPAYFLVHVYGSLLTATGRFRAFGIILIGSVALNALLNLLLIPRYGAFGCCVAALASQYCCGLGSFLVANRTFSLAPGIRSLIVYLAAAALLLVFFYFSRSAVSNVWIILAISVCFSVALLTTQISHFKKKFFSLR